MVRTRTGLSGSCIVNIICTVSGIKLKIQFVCALVVAAVADSLRKVKDFRAALKTKAMVDKEIREARYSQCVACPMFFRPLGTCGSPFRKSSIDGFDGCYCHCWTKAGTLANCAAYDHFNGQTIVGWPENLNSFPYEQPSSED